jgi:hypothetical protein
LLSSRKAEVTGSAPRRTELRRNRTCGANVTQRRQDQVRCRRRVEAVHLARPLEGAEKEQPVTQDRAAKRSAILVLFQIRLGLARPVTKESVRIENIIPQEFPQVSVEFVLAAPGQQIGVGRHRAEHRVVLRCLDLELGNRVRIRNRAGCVRAVDGVTAGRAVSIHIHALRSAAKRAGVIHIRRRPRRHGQYLSEIARIQGNCGNCLLIDKRTCGRSGRAQFAQTHHLFCRTARFEHRFQHRRF